MDMKRKWSVLMLCVAAGSLAAYNNGSAAHEQAMAVQSPAPAMHAFTVGTLEENDGGADLEGCTTSLMLVGAAPSSGDTFRESSSDKDGVGFMRIDGKLMRLTLVHSSNSEHDSTLIFEDASHTLKVVEALHLGETNEAADSTALAGTLTIIYKGATQTLRVEGGVAC
jgi:hypothetical protein